VLSPCLDGASKEGENKQPVTKANLVWGKTSGEIDEF